CVGFQLAFAHLSRYVADGINEFRSSTVVDGEAQAHAGIVLAEADIFIDFAQHVVGQIAAAANGSEANVLIENLPAFFDEILLQERHEEIEFGPRSFPILAAKTVKRQLPDTEPAAFLHRGANAMGATGMALDAR